MITSMTGFGRGTAEVSGASATVELRSVNNRFCEVSVRLPRSLADKESELGARLRSAFDRGKISVQVQLDKLSDGTLSLDVDPEAAQGYTRLLERLREAAGITAPIQMEHLLHFSDVFKPAEEVQTTASESAWQAVSRALEDAVRGMQGMRAVEGAALQADLERRLAGIERELVAVEARAPERVAEARDRLRVRLAELLTDERVNPDRIEMEMVMLADRLDVTEECVRLRSHIQVFRDAFTDPEPAGRKLNFLVQEMNREVNTIGSKANDPTIAHMAVRMKEELEKIREQVQNIE